MNRGRRGVIWATVAVLLAVAIGVALHWGHREMVLRAPGFRDLARESGIDFRMSFLPKEQGETFAAGIESWWPWGVAVGDSDNKAAGH